MFLQGAIAHLWCGISKQITGALYKMKIILKYAAAYLTKNLLTVPMGEWNVYNSRCDTQSCFVLFYNSFIQLDKLAEFI